MKDHIIGIGNRNENGNDFFIELGVNPNFESEVLRFCISTPLIPIIVYDYNMKERRLVVKEQVNVEEQDFSPQDYTVRKVFAKIPDSHRSSITESVPITLIHSKNLELNSKNPTLIKGYGAYGTPMHLDFDPRNLVLLKRGFVIAYAHVRGGSELGNMWYEEGKLLKKHNSFNDFITASEYLINSGITSRNCLAASGESAGGLLVASSILMRPDLYKCAYLSVPFLDVIGSMRNPDLELTTQDYLEWGNTENENELKNMESYSPIHLVQKIPSIDNLPYIYAHGGLYDTRVEFWQILKFAQKVREIFGEQSNNRVAINLTKHPHVCNTEELSSVKLALIISTLNQEREREEQKKRCLALFKRFMKVSQKIPKSSLQKKMKHNIKEVFISNSKENDSKRIEDLLKKGEKDLQTLSEVVSLPTDKLLSLLGTRLNAL